MVVYSWPEQLSGCWWLPMEKCGFEVQRADRGGTVQYSGKTVRIGVGKDGSAAIYGWSFPWTTRRKLGYAVERILLASGMLAFCKPHSSNFIYRVSTLPNYAWLENLKPEKAEIKYATNIGSDDAKRHYLCGSFRAGTEFVQFWTGPAIDSETKSLIHYVALGVDVLRLTSAPPDVFLNSLDLRLTSNGARRIEVQRELGA